MASFLALFAALLVAEPTAAQVPGVGPGHRVGDCWTDENGVNHCDGDRTKPEKPEKPPRTDGVSDADRIAANKSAAKTIARAAERLFYKDDYAGAEREYRRALALYDGDKDAWFTLGWAIHLQGRPGEALNAYKRAADLGHRKAKKRYEELSASLEAERESRRQDELRRWNQDQDRQRTYDEAVRLEEQSGGYAAAARLWLGFLRRYPDDVFALSSFGRCAYLARLADRNTPPELLDAAIAALRRAVRLDPSNGAHDRRLLLLLSHAGRADEAAVHARGAANKERDLAALKQDFYYATEWLLDRRDYAGFERLLEAGAPGLPADWVKSRYSYLRMAQYNAATSAGNKEGAVAASRALVELYPKDFRYRGLLGASLLRAGSTAEGTAVYTESMLLQDAGVGRAVVIAEYMAVHVNDTKDWRALLEDGRTLIARAPANDKFNRASVAGYHAELAGALLKLNRPVEARAELDVFLNHPPELGDVWFWQLRLRADEFEKEGSVGFSILINERALALKPGDADTAATLARLRAAAARESLALRPLVPAVPSGGSGTPAPGEPPVDGNGFERRLATSGDEIVRHARELRRQAGLPPREGRTVVPIPFSVWEKKVRDGQGLTPAELATFSRNDWNYLGRLVAELHRDGETSGGALTGRDVGRRASEAADRSGEWIAQNRETVEAAADLLEYGSIAVLPASVPVSVALGGAETSLSVLAKLLILKSEHPDKADVPKALAWIIGPEAVKKIGGDKLKTAFLQAGIPETRALQLGAMTIKEAVDSVGAPPGR